MTEAPEVHLGYIFEDMDPRSNGRRLKVVGFRQHHVACQVIEHRDRPQTVGQVRLVRIDRLRPYLNGYRLIATSDPGEVIGMRGDPPNETGSPSAPSQEPVPASEPAQSE